MPDEQHVILIDMGPAAGVRGVASYSAVDMYEKSNEALEKAMGTIQAMAEKTVKTIKSIPVSERPRKWMWSSASSLTWRLGRWWQKPAPRPSSHSR